MRRPLMLVGGILGTIFCVFGILGFVFMIPFADQILQLVNPEQLQSVGLAIGIHIVVTIPLLVFGLICNIGSIALFASKKQKYFKRIGMVVAAIVFNLILALMFVPVGPSEFASVINYVIFIGFIVAGTLQIVHLCIEKKPETIDEEEEKPKKVVAVAKQDKNAPMAENVTIDNIQICLERLAKLKEKGLITGPEFIQTKQRYLEKLAK